jgi:DNA-binding MarR family transcriptional regulator
MQNSTESSGQAGGQNPKDIALGIFRFRARRGIGVFYALFVIVPLVAAFMALVSAPLYVSQVSIVIVLLLVWLIARMAGMQRFHQMMMTIDALDDVASSEKPGHRLTRIIREGLATPILPLIAIAVVFVLGNNVYALGGVILWIVVAQYSNVRAFPKRSKDNILQRQIEDWLVVLTLPAIVALSVFHLSLVVILALIAPVWLGAGIKSLYQSPQSLYTELGSMDDVVKVPTATKAPDDRNLTELASAGVLSNSARVGILIALQGVERITFTDLLLSLKISKSSLNRSLKILLDAGYIIVHIGFKAAGRPRTFIQITPEGKTAIKDHLETMRQLTKKYLPNK